MVSLRQAYALGQLVYTSDFSLGVTLFKDQQNSPNELLKKADLVVFKAKENGKNQIQFFEERMAEELICRSNLENALKNAITTQELTWVIQPQVDMTTGKTLGGEVLLRWYPNAEFISPATFIPIAEDNQSIIPTSNWLVEDVFKFINTHKIHNLYFLINISPIHFFESNFISFLKSMVSKYQITPYQIKLEITEGIFLSDVEET